MNQVLPLLCQSIFRPRQVLPLCQYIIVSPVPPFASTICVIFTISNIIMVVSLIFPVAVVFVFVADGIVDDAVDYLLHAFVIYLLSMLLCLLLLLCRGFSSCCCRHYCCCFCCSVTNTVPVVVINLLNYGITSCCCICCR